MADEELELMADEDLEGQPDLTQLLERHARSISERIHTGGPGVATSINMDDGTISVQPAITKLGEEAEASIPEVKLLQLRSKYFEITLPFAVDDSLTLIHADRSLDDWNGDIIQATDSRSHDINDAMALPFGPGGGDETNLIIRRLDGAGIIHIGGTSTEAIHPIAKSDDVNTALGIWLDALATLLLAPTGPYAIATINTTLKTSLAAALSQLIKVA